MAANCFTLTSTTAVTHQKGGVGWGQCVGVGVGWGGAGASPV